MAITLQSEQSRQLNTNRLTIGSGWDTNHSSSGFNMDIDAAVFMLDENKKLPGDDFFIFYNNLKSRDNAVTHDGDDLTAGGSMEQIRIDLSKTDLRVAEILVLVTINDAEKRRQNFGQARNSYVRISNTDTKEELLKYDLDLDFPIENTFEFCRIYRASSDWKWEALGVGKKSSLQEYLKKYAADTNNIKLKKARDSDTDIDPDTKPLKIGVGVNWGGVESKSMLGFVTKRDPVDLDASCVLYNDKKQPIDVIYFENLKSKDDAVKHSGDDETGDMKGNDDEDNEIITVDFSKLSKSVAYVAFVLNSFSGQDFSSLPFASVRIYEGMPGMIKETYAQYDMTSMAAFAGNVSMVIGVFYKKDGQWLFKGIGQPTKDKKLRDTIMSVTRYHLNI